MQVVSNMVQHVLCQVQIAKKANHLVEVSNMVQFKFRSEQPKEQAALSGHEGHVCGHHEYMLCVWLVLCQV